jgi:WD40 repeat protein
MDVKPLHCYALTANPDRRVSSDLRKNGTRPPGFTSLVCHNPKKVIICGHSSGAIHVFRKSKQTTNIESISGETECLLPANGHEKLKDDKSAHKGPVTVLKFHPESHHLYSCSADRTIKLWVFRLPSPLARSLHFNFVPVCAKNLWCVSDSYLNFFSLPGALMHRRISSIPSTCPPAFKQ